MRPLDHVAELMASRPKRADTDRSFVVLHTEPELPPLPIDYNQPTERIEIKPR